MRRNDRIGLACQQWARVMRELTGITQPRDLLGAPRCTLAARRDLHHGSKSEKLDQNWPAFPFERASVDAWLVHRAYKAMRPELKEILLMDWVPLGCPRDLRAGLLGLSRKAYYERVGQARAAVETVFALGE